MHAPLLDQRFLVVGGSSGIGLATARAALSAGARVTIASRHREKLEAAKTELGQAVDIAVLDTADEAGLEAFLASNRGQSFTEGFGAILLADIDHFKIINDRFGHQFGDKVIADFAATLRDQVTDRGCAARLGGEEFAILFPGLSLKQAIALAERLRRSLEARRWPQSASDCVVTASFGVTLIGGDETVPAAIARADELLYRAKQAGRNRVVGDNISVIVPLRPLRTAHS